MRIIGDVHGKMNQYKQTLVGVEKSVQVGDMNFYYHELNGVDLNHRFFKGNHDGYNVSTVYDLGNYGVHEDMFFVRGAASIDKSWRVPGVDWFDNEELSMREMVQAIQAYTDAKPKIVLSHDCPQEVCEQLFDYNDRPLTRQGLQVMFETHQPELWIFGHHHKSKNEVINGTNFICLRELEFIDL